MIGATGYVGARLVPRLLAAGHDVQVLVRDPHKLARLSWADRVGAVTGEVTDAPALRAACGAVDTVVYLVHAMDGPDFRARDRAAAEALGAEARAAGVGRIVYLSGLQPPGGRVSAHLSSRREVGEVLRATGIPTAVLQAGVVVGAGSASFEMIRHLAATSPVLPLPDRAWNRVQPIGVDDVLHHLVACVSAPRPRDGTFDVGGPDVLTYAELVAGCATAAGLPRPLAVPVPVSAPRLTARAVGALTPAGRHLAAPLLESMTHELVCVNDPPGPPPPGGPVPYAEAVRRALAAEGDAAPGPTDPPGSGGVLVGEHGHDVAAPAAQVWAVVAGLGGDTGWYTVPGVWALRGAIDRLLGGPGARRTRPARLEPGAALDWWRIEAVEPGRLLRLRAETRLPGTARLELRVEPRGPRACRYLQRVTFAPDGLPGRLYWYAQKPLHDLVFAVMARTVTGVAERAARRAG